MVCNIDMNVYCSLISAYCKRNFVEFSKLEWVQAGFGMSIVCIQSDCWPWKSQGTWRKGKEFWKVVCEMSNSYLMRLTLTSLNNYKIHLHVYHESFLIIWYKLRIDLIAV